MRFLPPSAHSLRQLAVAGAAAFCGLGVSPVSAQSIAIPWSGYGHDPQHSALSPQTAQSMRHILWQTPVDLQPQYSGIDLLIHYGTPLITRQNTVLVPVKTGVSDGFRIEAHDAATGAVKWTETTDYSLPPHGWTPACNIVLTPRNRLYFPGAGGTVYFRDAPDSTAAPPPLAQRRLCFYGLANHDADSSTFDANVKINTPITADRYGNIYFGFEVGGATSNPSLQSGIARIGEDGSVAWISASAAAQNAPDIVKVVLNCAPALSNDHKTLYIAVSAGNFSGGYLVSLNSRTLAPIARVRLKDVHVPSADAALADDGTASPTVGPDEDVYYGVLEYGLGSNHYRGWLLHFDKTLGVTKTPGAFGWDDTASIVPASAVSSYTGTSDYLVLTKYNNYAGYPGGDGHNKVAVLDPNATMTDPVTGSTVMNEVITVLGLTPDAQFAGQYPGAVREWCINTAAVDPIGKCALINSEDGKMYRWDFTTNALTETLTLTSGIGEAYTPTAVGVDGTVYAISNATLFALGM